MQSSRQLVADDARFLRVAGQVRLTPTEDDRMLKETKRPAMRPFAKSGEPTVTEADQERAAFEQSWRVLAPNFEQAKAVRTRAVEDPNLLSEPRNRALVTWLDGFERQLVALETLHKAATDSSVELPLDDLRLARKTADDLLEALDKTHELARESRLA
jgi:hypothetical protein